MVQLNLYGGDDPRHHTTHIKNMLAGIRDQARADVIRVKDDKAQALFKVTVEVLEGLIVAYDHYEQGIEEILTD